MSIRSTVLFFFLSLFLFVCSCKKENNTLPLVNLEERRIRGEIYANMKIVYYWVNSIPFKVDTNANIKPSDFFHSLLNQEIDRWSFITTKEEFNSFENGQYFGYGIMFAYDEYGNIRVAFVYRNTQAYTAGIRRGWILKTVNEKPITSYTQLEKIIGNSQTQDLNTFEFINNEGNIITISLTKEIITVNPVLMSTIFSLDHIKVGYVALATFMGNNIKKQLNDIFNDFNINAIDDLIVDLRYNAGGELENARYLASLIVGRIADYRIFVNLWFNQVIQPYLPDSNKFIYIKTLQNSLEKTPKRVFFITTTLSASASEALIKGLQPYISTYLIGTRTYGKPVGMIPIELNSGDYVMVPVMFEWKNANYENSGYTGIGVNCPEFDDLDHDFGDPQELCLKQAIHFINTGGFITHKKNDIIITSKKPPLTGYRAEVGAF